MHNFPTMAPGEQRTLVFEFADDIGSDGTITSVESVSVQMYRGVDPYPSDILQAVATPTGTSVYQAVKAPADGANKDYLLTCTIDTGAAEKPVLAGILRVRGAT